MKVTNKRQTALPFGIDILINQIILPLNTIYMAVISIRSLNSFSLVSCNKPSLQPQDCYHTFFFSSSRYCSSVQRHRHISMQTQHLRQKVYSVSLFPPSPSPVQGFRSCSCFFHTFAFLYSSALFYAIHVVTGADGSASIGP